MPVTTRRQLMGLSHPNAISERGPTEDTLPRTMQESDDDDDPMDGSFAVLSSSEEDEDHEPVRDEPESGASEEALDHEESDLLEVDDDYEGTFNTIKVYTSCKLRTQFRLPKQNALSWGKSRERHHRNLPRRPRGLESVAGFGADCRTCCRCPLMSYSWYVRVIPRSICR
jgi:hypothetical protein